MSWRGDMEAAVTEAKQMAQVTVEYIGSALGFDMLEEPPLTREQKDLLQYVVLETFLKIRKAEEVFYREEEA